VRRGEGGERKGKRGLGREEGKGQRKVIEVGRGHFCNRKNK
jgi:hypothetical protein